MLLRLVVAVGGGLALALASEPVGLAVLTPLALAALFVVVHGLTPRRGALVGLGFGTAFYFTLIFWMRAVGWDAWLALSAVQAAFFVPLGWALARLSGLRAWPVWSAAAYVAVESVSGSWPLSGMPWGRLSYAVADTVWAPALPWTGFTGLSFLLALTGASLAWLVLERPPLRRAAPVVVALVAATLLPTAVPWDPGTGERVRVAVVQGDVPGSGDDVVAVHRDVTANHVRATVELGEAVAAGRQERPDFVLWPENSTAVDPFKDAEVNQGIEAAVEAVGVPVLVGAIVDSTDAGSVLNQGIVWHPDLGSTDRYTKRHPVPFGEYIPWRDALAGGNFGKLRLIPRDQLSGTRTRPLDVAGVPVADAICFDVAYDDGLHAQVRGGGGLVAVQTSNAMFIRTNQIAQQFEITRLRALETGRYVVVAATNGISGVVGPDGEVRAAAEPRTTAVLVEEVGLSARVTPAVRMGRWPGAVVALVALAALAGTFRRPGRRRERGPDRGAGMPYSRRAPEPSRGNRL